MLRKKDDDTGPIYTHKLLSVFNGLEILLLASLGLVLALQIWLNRLVLVVEV